MNLWYKKASIFVVAGVVYLVGQYFRGVWFQHFFINPCRYSTDNWGVFCNSPYVDTLGWPLIDLGQMLAVIAIILLFANAAAFRAWLKFSVFYIPIAIALDLIIYPNLKFGLGFMSGYQPTNYFLGVYPFGWLFVIISLLLIIYKYFTSRSRIS